MGLAHVAHDCRLGDGVIVINYAGITGHCQIGDRATVGGLTGMVPFTRIGTCAYVGGMAKVNADVPPYMLVDGQPATVRGGERDRAAAGRHGAGRAPGAAGRLSPAVSAAVWPRPRALERIRDEAAARAAGARCCSTSSRPRPATGSAARRAQPEQESGRRRRGGERLMAQRDAAARRGGRHRPHGAVPRARLRRAARRRAGRRRRHRRTTAPRRSPPGTTRSAFGDHRELIGQVDVASVAVPTEQHFHVARDLLEAGISVLVEKPMTPTLEEARELFAVARRSGRHPARRPRRALQRRRGRAQADRDRADPDRVAPARPVRARGCRRTPW